MKMKILLLLFVVVYLQTEATTTEVFHNKWCGYGRDNGLCYINMDGSLSCTSWKGGYSIDDFTEDGKTVTKTAADGGKFIHMACSRGRSAMCAITDKGTLAIWQTKQYNKVSYLTWLTTGEYTAANGKKYVSCSIARGTPTFSVLRDDGYVELYGNNMALHRTRYQFDKDAGRVAQDGTWRRELPPRSITKYQGEDSQDTWMSNDGTVNATQPMWYESWGKLGYDQHGAIDLLTTGGSVCAITEEGKQYCVGPSRGAYIHSPVVKGKKYIKGGCAGGNFVCPLTDAGTVNCFYTMYRDDDENRYAGGAYAKSFEPSNIDQGGKFVSCACGAQFVCCQRDDGVVECPKQDGTPEMRHVLPKLTKDQEAALAQIRIPLPTIGGSAGGSSGSTGQTACDVDGCIARCEKIYGAGDPSYMCKKGCADMEAGQVKDRNLVCNTNLEATTYSNCLTRCSQPNRISSVAANRAKCANGCEFWNKPVAAAAASAMAACPVSFTASLQSACSCEGEATECSVGQFCYGGGCKGQAQCPVRQDVDKNLFYGAKVYGNWNASTKIMSMNFTTPWDVSVQSMTWKNAASDQLKYTSASMGLWKKDTSNACAPTYKLDVPQTTFFGAGSKFNIKGSQLSTTMRVAASETVTTVKNGQTYTYNRNIKNTVPILVNLVTKTTIAVRFRSTIAEPGPGPAPKLEDFVLFIGAEDNFADADPNVLITMQVHSRACIDNTGNSKGVAVTTGLDNIAPGKASEFTWKTDSNGNIEKSYEHNLCVETLMWKFVPKQYRENTYEISLEFTLRGTGEKFTSIAAIDIKQGDVLSDIGFTTDIKTYDDEGCTTENNKFILGQKFYTKISLSDLIVNTNNITCNTYKIKQTKNGVTTTTDLKAEVKYAFMEKKSALNTHICGAELESHHFHISVDGYDTLLETEILITYDQTNTRRKLIQVPFTEEMFDAAGYDLTNEWALGDGIELSDEDLAFQSTKRAPDTDDMVVEMFIEADKAVGTLFTEESMNTFKNLFMMATVLGCAGFVFGYVSNKFKSDDYVALIEMQNE